MEFERASEPGIVTSRTAWRVSRVTAFACAVGVAAACGGDDSDSAYDVTTQVVSHETTQDMLVFSPDADGSWPVVFALHGIDGKAEDLTELATRLAGEGLVVFAPTYRSDLTSFETQVATAVDVECSYRFARSIAADHGGDLDEPVTFVGWSMGATLALQGGLTEDVDPTGQFVPCFSNVPRADAIVAISGCHLDFQGMEVGFYDPSSWGNPDADVVLVAGDADTKCPASQSEQAAADLRAAGYDVELVMLEEADHFGPVFHDFVDGEMTAHAHHPAGEQTLDVILGAIGARQDGR